VPAGIDFDAVLNPEMLEGRTRQRVRDLTHAFYDFHPRVTDADQIVQNRRIHVQKHVFVDRNCKYESTMLPIE
jgi:hypothetical protein